MLLLFADIWSGEDRLLMTIVMSETAEFELCNTAFLLVVTIIPSPL
jgi:hypothetical protein